MARVKVIRLCAGHEGGFGLLKIMSPTAVYRGVSILKLKVLVVGKEICVQCLASRKGRGSG